ncbi:MAG TPA: (d)CMP kinase [Streptosporangiaceae bacterium]|nr:(d)CMP kinase [Streptosporangiaceae bacterium]
MADCLVIAVDGPSGSGKSSAARGTAKELGIRYLDTGAMYRALTWWLLARQVDVTDAATVAASVTSPDIEVGIDPDAPFVMVDGTDVSGPIRSRPVSNAVSAVASVPAVRTHLIAQQREIIAKACAEFGGIVAEGRDIGTVVAPDAVVKVFLTASESVRASRRAADLTADPAATVELTRIEQARRDRLDAPHSERAADAVPIDSTGLGVTEVVSRIVALVQERTAGDVWTS